MVDRSGSTAFAVLTSTVHQHFQSPMQTKYHSQTFKKKTSAGKNRPKVMNLFRSRIPIFGHRPRHSISLSASFSRSVYMNIWSYLLETFLQHLSGDRRYNNTKKGFRNKTSLYKAPSTTSKVSALRISSTNRSRISRRLFTRSLRKPTELVFFADFFDEMWNEI